jgi:SAM-dependent methyltransferase
MALWVLRRQGTLERTVNRSANFLSGLLLGRFENHELSWLTARLYDDRGEYEAHGIHPWEVTWFEEDLPPSPAHLLVAGSGSGREAAYLTAQGYQVTAFDPAPSFIERARRDVPMARHLVGSLEDLLDPGSDLAVAIGRDFQAVLVGWGVFSHIPGRANRAAVLAALRAHCPDGPIMASFFLADDWDPERSRARRFGAAIGARLRRTGKTVEAGDFLAGRFGYAHWFTTAEMESLAQETGHRLARHPMASPGAYPHATFLPAGK